MVIPHSLPRLPNLPDQNRPKREIVHRPTQRQNYDRSNQELCPFWEKVGACRHGYNCVRKHTKPSISKTVVFWKLYPNPVRTYFKRPNNDLHGDDSNNSKNQGIFVQNDVEIDEKKLREIASDLYQDLFVELSLKFGEIDDIAICGNFNPHLGGNVYVKFRNELSAAKCIEDCNNRWYNDKPIYCEFSPVSNFDDSSCREFNGVQRCARGDQCNLMHLRKPNREIKQMLYASQREYYRNIDNKSKREDHS